METVRQHRQSAVIVRESENGHEPYAQFEDGRIMPMGWNCGDKVAVGTRGTAEYVSDRRAGLWQFRPFWKVVEGASGELLTKQGDEACMTEICRFISEPVAVAFLEREYGTTDGFTIRDEDYPR
jgi:hypothetical protein